MVDLISFIMAQIVFNWKPSHCYEVREKAFAAGAIAQMKAAEAGKSLQLAAADMKKEADDEQSWATGYRQLS